MARRHIKHIYVIIGGPGFGKTTIVKELEKRGYNCQYDPCTPEFFKHLANTDPELTTYSPEFNRRIVEKRVEQFKAAPCNCVCFFDRGIPDSLAYLNEVPKELLDRVKKFKYERIVFVMPPWPEIFVRHVGRDESYEEALRLHKRIIAIYKKLGYRLIEVPKAETKVRVGFILSKLGEHR